LDPCFAHIGPIATDATCTNQVRLVFQPIKDGSAIDAALHVFYELSRGELLGLAQAIVTLRASQQPTPGDDLGPLAVHPIVAAQGLGGPMSQGLAEAVKSYVGVANLTRITRMRGGGDDIWHFDGFDIDDGHGQPMTIPTLPANTTEVIFDTQAIQGFFKPETQSPDDLALLASHAKGDAATPERRQATFDAISHISNPNVHSPDTIDCATCHAADPIRFDAQRRFGLSPSASANAFAPDPTIPVADVAHTTPDSFSPTVNIHAMSYRAKELAINQRVINETAALVAYFNQTFLKK
jgi:hypothetical protein